MSDLDIDGTIANLEKQLNVGSAVAASSTVISPLPHGNFVPAERAEAKNRSSEMGKLRSARRVRITLPTCPVAPTTPTRIGDEVNGSARPATSDFYWRCRDHVAQQQFLCMSRAFAACQGDEHIGITGHVGLRPVHVTGRYQQAAIPGHCQIGTPGVDHVRALFSCGRNGNDTITGVGQPAPTRTRSRARRD